MFIVAIRHRFPLVDLVWKSPMAVHIHVVDLERVEQHDKETASLFGINRIRYMSSSRAKFLYDAQKQLMKSLDVPLLDIFEATYLSSDRLYPSDGRHYRPNLNRLMLGWFYGDGDATKPSAWLLQSKLGVPLA